MATQQPEISIKDLIRFRRAAKQVAAYANFLRWSTNFRRDSITVNPECRQVQWFSPMLSGRFAFELRGDVLLLGVQPFEVPWMGCMPFSKAYIDDERLYLAVDAMDCMDSKLPNLIFGLFVDSSNKSKEMSAAKSVQIVEIKVEQGEVVSVGCPHGDPIPLEAGDVKGILKGQAVAKRKQQDHDRFF